MENHTISNIDMTSGIPGGDLMIDYLCFYYYYYYFYTEFDKRKTIQSNQM